MADDQNASDLELVRRIKGGDDQAFREMVERYHARVYSLSYGVLHNAEDAEEATQDAFLTLYRKLSLPGLVDHIRYECRWITQQ